MIADVAGDTGPCDFFDRAYCNKIYLAKNNINHKAFLVSTTLDIF